MTDKAKHSAQSTLPWNIDRVLASPLYRAQASVVAGWDWPEQWPDLAALQNFLAHRPQAIHTVDGLPLRVVEQSERRSDDWREGYEPRIFFRGELQTRRENWHDFFNLVTWAGFPRAKAALNARQTALIAARAHAARQDVPRSPEQDALTQFDESGVIVLCADVALQELLEGFRWKSLFWEHRERVFSQMRCYLFGHGLMERALTPYRGLTGKAVILTVPETLLEQSLEWQLAEVDAQLAQRIQQPDRFARPRALAPLPVLGFPGFAPENAEATYYDDVRYFRPGRNADRAGST